jgi:hypothetical protein
VGGLTRERESEMELKTQEHIDLMAQFEKQFRGRRLDREAKEFWAKQRIYQDGQVNELFLAFRQGYALAKAIYQSSVAA